MAFKMKGSPMHRNFGIGKAPLNQTAPSEDTKNPNYNQEIDQENADKVMEKRTSDLQGFREKAEGFEATSQEQVDKINAQDKKNMEAYNFSADSINTSNSNAADRLKADQAGDFDSLFKQKRTGPKDQSKNDPTNLGLGTTVTNPGAEVPGSPEVTTTKHIKGANPKSYSDLHNMPVPLDGDMTKEERARYERFQANSPVPQKRAQRKIKKSKKAIDRANTYMRDNMTEGTKLAYDEEGNSSVVGSGTYGTSDKKVIRKADRLVGRAGRKSAKADKAVNKYNSTQNPRSNDPRAKKRDQKPVGTTGGVTKTPSKFDKRP